MSTSSQKQDIWGEVMSQNSGSVKFLSQPGGEDETHMARIVINKNDSISRRISKILKIIKGGENEDEVEMILIASGESIQKLVTIVEIVKQKIVKRRSKASEKNDRMANIDGDNVAVIGKSESELPSFWVDQFNYLDYTLENKSDYDKKKKKGKKETSQHTTMGYSKQEIDILKGDRKIRIPMLYIYLNMRKPSDDESKREALKDKIDRKFSELIDGGWSHQQE